MLHWYNWFSWWWARGCSKHVENWNKHVEKNCASSWSFTKNNNNKLYGRQHIIFFSDAIMQHPEVVFSARISYSLMVSFLTCTRTCWGQPCYRCGGCFCVVLVSGVGTNWKIQFIIWYIDIFVKLQLGCHPVAVVQYTFTHKQYSTVHIYTQTVHRTTQNKPYIEKHKNYWKSAGRAPSLQVVRWHLPYNWEKKSMEKPQSG